MPRPEIDPVEIALAVIGVRPLISKAVERVTAAQFEEMDRYPRRLEQLATQVVRGDELGDIPLGGINYVTTLRELSEKYDERQLTEMISRFRADHHDLASAFQTKAMDVLTYLRGLCPVAVSTSLAGQSNWRPSEIVVRRFVCVLEVLDDPTRVFPLMAGGALLRRQVQAMRSVYPTLSKFLDAAIDDPLDGAIVEAKTAKKSFELTPHAERGARVWLGKPLAGKLHKALQDGYREQDAKRQAAAAKPAPRGDILAKESLTNAQRALYPQTRETT